MVRFGGAVAETVLRAGGFELGRLRGESRQPSAGGQLDEQSYEDGGEISELGSVLSTDLHNESVSIRRGETATKGYENDERDVLSRRQTRPSTSTP